MVIKRHILMETAGNDGVPGGSGYSTQVQPPAPPANTPSSETTGVPAPPDSKPVVQEEGVPQQDPKTPESQQVPPPPQPAEEKPLELNLEGIEELEGKKLSEFAKAHKLTKEQAQALVENRKAELTAMKADDAKFVTEQEAKKQAAKAKWEQELRDDPVFGKDNYVHSVNRVDKLLAEKLPRFGKMLTKGNIVLPADVMRDLNDVALLVYGTESFVGGDNNTSKQAAKSPLDYYSN